jgi:GT2 family glycosyltransferase
MPDQPRVTIIILSWNQQAVTLACLASLSRLTYPRLHLLLVDNGSTDGTPEAVRGVYPAVEVLVLPENRLFAGGNNAGIRHALDQGAEMVLLLNNDTEVEPGFLEPMVARARSAPRCGMVAPKIYYHSDPRRLWYAGGEVSFWTGTLWHVGLREIDNGQHDAGGETGYATGCCVLVPREVIQRCGMLDETFRMYTEDADWSWRIRAAGYSIQYEPAAHVWHKISVSTGGHLSGYKMTRKYVSNIRFMARHARWYHWLTFPWLNILSNAAAAGRYLLTRGGG